MPATGPAECVSRGCSIVHPEAAEERMAKTRAVAVDDQRYFRERIEAPSLFRISLETFKDPASLLSRLFERGVP